MADIIDYDLRALSNKFPVPADCPTYLKASKVRKMPDFNPNYIPYIGKPEWCAKCCIHGTYCDGHDCKTHIETIKERQDKKNDHRTMANTEHAEIS